MTVGKALESFGVVDLEDTAYFRDLHKEIPEKFKPIDYRSTEVEEMWLFSNFDKATHPPGVCGFDFYEYRTCNINVIILQLKTNIGPEIFLLED